MAYEDFQTVYQPPLFKQNVNMTYSKKCYHIRGKLRNIQLELVQIRPVATMP